MRQAVNIYLFVMIATVLMFNGCASKPVPIGFLTDYSRLEATSDGSLRYINPNKNLGEYSQFIIDPVVVHFHEEAKGVLTDPETLTQLRDYMYDAIVNVLSDRYEIVSRPAYRVARIRVAITDVNRSTPALNIIPHTKLTGAGLGGAAMEAEMIDSQTGEQIGAVIDSKKGKRLSFAGVTKWGDAKAVMDGWARRFRKRLDEAHRR